MTIEVLRTSMYARAVPTGQFILDSAAAAGLILKLSARQGNNPSEKKWVCVMKEGHKNKPPNQDKFQALAARARAGAPRAFVELYELTSPVLYRLIRSMIQDEDLIWDILQDSYLRAFRSLDKLEENGAFLSWLRRIAVNETARQMSKRLPLSFTELTGEDDENQPEPPDLRVENQPELALDRKETSRLVQEILASLPESQQLIIGMRYYEDMPVKEIASLLHLAPGTVKAQLFQGRKKIEARVRALEEQGVTLLAQDHSYFQLAPCVNWTTPKRAEILCY